MIVGNKRSGKTLGSIKWFNENCKGDCYCSIVKTEVKESDRCIDYEPFYPVILGLECCNNCIHSEGSDSSPQAH
jgi:hypothetical protein